MRGKGELVTGMDSNVGAGRRVVLGVGGGVAAYKAASLLRLFTESGFDVTVVPTDSALRFVGEPTWSALSGNPVSSQVWDSVEQVRHVLLGQRADLVVVAPATADLLARAAHGMADDLLTNVLLTASGPVVMAPAMHTEMWEHPATTANVNTLRSRGVHVLDPASGRLTGKDTGKGRLPDPEDIYAAALEVLDGAEPAAEQKQQPLLAGLHVLVTAGGTREAIDPVRFIGNRSSGKQGYALAEVAVRLGAQVTVVAANVALPDPDGARVISVESAAQMQEAVLGCTFGVDEASGGDVAHGVDNPIDVVVMAAAVADFRPRSISETKIKKTDETDSAAQTPDAPTIELVRNPDILAGLVAERRSRRTGPLLVGFAAETGDSEGTVVDYARAKLRRKGVDLLVANEVGHNLTFGKDSSTVHLLAPDSTGVVTIGPADKHEIAHAVWARVREILNQP